MSKETERAWAAGFFDGEGSTIVQTSKRRYFYPRISVGQSGEDAPEILRRFQAAVGSGHVKGPYVHSRPGAKAIYYWVAFGWRGCLPVWRALWPYLSRVKRDQARVVWARCMLPRKEQTNA